MKPKEFSQKTFDTISLCCGTYLPACRYSQTLFTGSVGKNENSEMFCALTFSTMKHPFKIGRFKQPFLLAKGESLHGQQISTNAFVLGKAKLSKGSHVAKQLTSAVLFFSFCLIRFSQPSCSSWIRNQRFFSSLHCWVDKSFSKYTP